MESVHKGHHPTSLFKKNSIIDDEEKITYILNPFSKLESENPSPELKLSSNKMFRRSYIKIYTDSNI